MALKVLIKEKLVNNPLRRKLESSMGLKFVAAMTVVVSILMIAGTAFVARMMRDGQVRAIEMRGREMGLFLGRAAVDHIQIQDVVGIDTLASEAVKSSQDMIYTVIVDASGAAALSTMMGSFSHDDAAVQKIIGAEPTGDVLSVRRTLKKRLDPIEVSADIMHEGARLGSVVMGFSRKGVERDMWNIVWLLLATSVGIVALLSLVVWIMVMRMIVRPTRVAEAAAFSIAGGDLAHRVRVSSTDELGRLGRGLNTMIISLKEMIGSVRGSAQSVTAVSTQLGSIAEQVTQGSRQQSEAVEESASSVNEMHFSLKEIASNVDDLHRTAEHTSSSAIQTSASVAEVARTMSELSTSIEDTTTAITQMYAAIREIAEHVSLLSAAADETAASATEITASVKEVEASAERSASLAAAVASDAQELGMRAVDKTTAGMKEIEATARRSAEAINRLGERAENIGSILTVIEDITDQTSLLALNAAILAAQAGEHGKGFAVVATEIRELANRTAASTKEIGGLIGAVQAETKDAVESMRQGVEIVEQGTRLTRDAGDALRKILERARESQEMSRGISRAAVEQAKGIRQVSQAVDRITTMSHQIAAATNEQKTGSEQIMRATERMREITAFVKNSATEQAKGSQEITRSVETMAEKIALVNRAAGEVQAGSELIVTAIERIKDIAKSNAHLASQLGSSIQGMSEKAAALNREIDRFRMDERAGARRQG